MLYPIYVHKDKNSAYGAIFPDFPDELQALPAAAQEAVEVHFHGESDSIPKPSSPEVWNGDERFEGGYWMLVALDMSKLNTKAVRLNTSLPENLLNRIDAEAKARHLSRSAFLAVAVEREMAQHRA